MVLDPENRAVFDRILDSFPHTDRRLKSYVDHARDRMWLTLQHLPRGTGRERLLDIGSFEGLFAPAYIDLWNYAEVELLGYDVNQGGEIRRTNAQGRTYRFPTSHANIELDRFPFPDESFDAVVCTDVIEHLIFDPMFTVNEMSRVLKRGGIALIAVPNAVSDTCLTLLVNNVQPGFLRQYFSDALATGRRDLGTVYNLGHFHEYTAPELAAMAEAAGFQRRLLTSFNHLPPQYDSFRFRVLKRLVKWLFPHSPRTTGEEIVALFEKIGYTPLDRLANRYPTPLYRPLVPE